MKKTAAVVILILFVWSGVAIALDQHDESLSADCPICHTKHLLQGDQKPFALEVQLRHIYYEAGAEKEYERAVALVHSAGRSPPSF